MKLTIKPIINGLFHTTVSYEGFEATAVGHTKDEATKKALEWLRREVEFYYEVEEADSPDIEMDEESDLDYIEDLFGNEELALCSEEILKDEIWESLEEEVQKFAIEVAKIAIRAALGYTIRASVGGSMGGLLF